MIKSRGWDLFKKKLVRLLPHDVLILLILHKYYFCSVSLFQYSYFVIWWILDRIVSICFFVDTWNRTRCLVLGMNVHVLKFALEMITDTSSVRAFNVPINWKSIQYYANSEYFKIHEIMFWNNCNPDFTLSDTVDQGWCKSFSRSCVILVCSDVGTGVKDQVIPLRFCALHSLKKYQMRIQIDIVFWIMIMCCYGIFLFPERVRFFITSRKMKYIFDRLKVKRNN